MGQVTSKHDIIKEIVLNKLEEMYGAGLTEYLDSGRKSDVYTVTSDGIAIFVEVIWTPTKSQFNYDLIILHQSKADVKIVLVNPELLKNPKRRRDFEKARIAERKRGVAISNMIDGSLIVEDREFVNKDLKRIVEQLVFEARQKRRISVRIPSKYLIVNDERAKRVMSVYVKPNRYEEAENMLKKKKLLIITGAAHLGKTSLGYYLGITNTGKIAKQFLRFPEDGYLNDIESVDHSIIFFDDPFGGSTFKYSAIANNLGRIRDLIRNNNYIIIASRKEVLYKAMEQSKIGENNLKKNIFELTTDDYSNVLLKEMLYNHLEYYHVPDEGRRIVSTNEDLIIRHIKFPHNLQVFVGNELEQVVKRTKYLSQAIESAKEIEKACGKWFSRFYLEDREVFSFILSVTLFHKWNEKYFWELCKRTMKAIGLNAENLDISYLKRLKSQTASYISQETGFIKFAHPSYEEGIFSEIKNSYPALIKKVANEIPWLMTLLEDRVDISGIIRKTITVKFAGIIVEKGFLHDVWGDPLHPFTKYLKQNISKEKMELDEQVEMLEDINYIVNLTYKKKLEHLLSIFKFISVYATGHSFKVDACLFYIMCPYAVEYCRKEQPILVPLKNKHKIACHHYTPDCARARH